MTSMRSSRDVATRIMWDSNISSERFTVGYLDRFTGIQERAFDDFNWGDLACLSHTELAIPHHRIQYFKYGDRIVWDKRGDSRFDSFFGSYGNSCSLTSIDEIIANEIHNQEPCTADDDGAEMDNVLPEPEQLEPEHDEQEMLQMKRPISTFRKAALNAPRPTHFICCRILSSRVQSAVQAIQNSDPVLQQGALPIARLHFTLLTLRLENERDIYLASRALETFDLDGALGIDQPFHFESVELFSNRVLYGSLRSHDAKRMARVHDLLRNHMIASLGTHCWLGATERSFTPHMTISKKSRAMSRESKILHNTMCARFRNDLCSSKFRLRAVHLCPMGKPDKLDDFYPLLASRLSEFELARHQHEMCCLVEKTKRFKPVQGPLEFEAHMSDISRRLREQNTLLPVGSAAAAWTLRIIRGVETVEKHDFCTTSTTSQICQILIDPTNALSGWKRFIAALSANLIHSTSATSTAGGPDPTDITLVSTFQRRSEYQVFVQLARRCAGCKVQVVQFDSSSSAINAFDQEFYIRQRQLAGWENDEQAIKVGAAQVRLPTSSTNPMTTTTTRRHLLAVDLDKTLLMTADAPAEWSEMVSSWVACPMSIDSSIDTQVSAGPAFNWLKQMERSNVFLVILTGRSENLRPQVEHLLERWDIKPDCVILKDSQKPTFDFKADAMEQMTRSACFSSCTFVDDDLRNLQAVRDRMRHILDPESIRCQCIDPRQLEATTTTTTTTTSNSSLDNPHFKINSAHDMQAVHELTACWAAKVFASVLLQQKSIGRELSEQLDQVFASTPQLAALQFGSTCYGRNANASKDLDLCFLSPVALMDDLYQTMRASTNKTTQRAQGDKVNVLNSHYSKRARCPRISLQLEVAVPTLNRPIVMDLDIVVAVLNPQGFICAVQRRMIEFDQNSDLFVEPTGTSTFLQYCLQQVDASPKRSLREQSVKALTGPLCVARIRETLTSQNVSLAAFGNLVETVSQHLDSLSLRFQAFQGFKTFQIALLIEEYVKSPRSAGSDNTLNFEAFSTFVTQVMDRKHFLRTMEGIYHDNRDSFATCNMAYSTRLLQAFDQPHARFDFQSERASANLYRCEIRVKSVWKASILFSAGFPAVMRQVQQHAPSSFFVGHFVAQDEQQKMIQAEFAASFNTDKNNSAQEHALMERCFSCLVLPPGSHLRLFCHLSSLRASDEKLVMEKHF